MTQEKLEEEHEGNISRCPHDSEHPFTMISNELVRNKNVTPESRGILIYLLSHSTKWKTSRAHIIKDQDIGKDKLKRIFDELILKGYVKVFYYYDEKGYRRVRYTFSEIPMKTSIPSAGNPPKVQEKAPEKLKKIVPSAGNPPEAKPDCLEDCSFKNIATAIDNAREEEIGKTAAACSSKNSSKENSEAVDEKTSLLALEPVSEVETTSKAAATAEVEKPAEEPKAQDTASSFICHINPKFPKEVIDAVRSWIHVSLDFENDKSLIRAVVAKFNATEVGAVKSVRMWLTDMLRKMSPVKLDDEVQAPAVEKSSKNLAAALFEKVDKKFGADKLSGAYEAIEKALKSYSQEVVRMIIDDINLKSAEKVNKVGGLLMHLCKENGSKPARGPVDTSQLEKRKIIAKGLRNIASVNGGCYTFDEKKLFEHTGTLTKEYSFTGHNEFWDEKDKFFEKHYPIHYRAALNPLQSNKT